jgi:hypothetical protein
MSLGGGKSPSLDQAVDKASLSGLHFAVAAGNFVLFSDLLRPLIISRRE